jgi:hypothetical protein
MVSYYYFRVFLFFIFGVCAFPPFFLLQKNKMSAMVFDALDEVIEGVKVLFEEHSKFVDSAFKVPSPFPPRYFSFSHDTVQTDSHDSGGRSIESEGRPSDPSGFSHGKYSQRRWSSKGKGYCSCGATVFYYLFSLAGFFDFLSPSANEFRKTDIIIERWIMPRQWQRTVKILLKRASLRYEYVVSLILVEFNFGALCSKMCRH